MDWKTIIYWFSDGSINDLLTLIMKDFKVLGLLIGGPLLLAVKWIANKTPWKTDDELVSALSERIGVNQEGDKK